MLPRKSLLGLLIGVSDPEAYAMLAYGNFHRMHAVCFLYAPYKKHTGAYSMPPRLVRCFSLLDISLINTNFKANAN